MFEFIKSWKRNKHIKKIEAYREIPQLLKDMDNCLASTVEEAVANPPFPPNEMQRKLGLVAEELIKAEFPDMWPDIVEFARENGVEVNDVASAVMGSTILPTLLETLAEEMEKTMHEIETICEKGIDKELIGMRRKGR